MFWTHKRTPKASTLQRQNAEETIRKWKVFIEERELYPFVFSFIGKGGVGKSLLSFRIAELLHNMEQMVFIFDRDPAQGGVTKNYLDYLAGRLLSSNNSPKKTLKEESIEQFLRNPIYLRASRMSEVLKLHARREVIEQFLGEVSFRPALFEEVVHPKDVGAVNAYWNTPLILAAHAMRSKLGLDAENNVKAAASLIFDLPGASEDVLQNEDVLQILSQSDAIFFILGAANQSQFQDSLQLLDSFLSEHKALIDAERNLLHVIVNNLSRSMASKEGKSRLVSAVSRVFSLYGADAPNPIFVRHSENFAKTEHSALYGLKERGERYDISEALYNFEIALKKIMHAQPRKKTVVLKEGMASAVGKYGREAEEERTVGRGITRRQFIEGFIEGLIVGGLAMLFPALGLNKPEATKPRELFSEEDKEAIKVVRYLFSKKDPYLDHFIAREPFVITAERGNTLASLLQWAFQRYSGYLNLDDAEVKAEFLKYRAQFRRANANLYRKYFLNVGDKVSIPAYNGPRATNYGLNLFALKLLDGLTDGKVRLVSLFSEPRSYGGVIKGHPGIDLADHYGAKLHALRSGRVCCKAFSATYGYYIGILTNAPHPGIDFYAHLAKMPRLRIGHLVNRGDFIGYMGDTGDAKAPHTHYEVRVFTDDGRGFVQINPLNNIMAWAKYLISVYGDIARERVDEGSLSLEKGFVNVPDRRAVFINRELRAFRRAYYYHRERSRPSHNSRNSRRQPSKRHRRRRSHRRTRTRH